jgi:ribosomal protein L37E
MITEFCMHCGNKIEYALHKPNFCSSCGSPLNNDSKNNQTEKTEKAEASIEEEQSTNNFSNISKLEYTINKDNGKLTFGDLISQASQDSNEQYSKQNIRPNAEYNPDEDIIKSTMQQCRSKREPEDIGGQ